MLDFAKLFFPYLKRIGFVIVLFSFCRLLFLLFNFSLLGGNFSYLPFIGGIRFDLSSISLLFAPFTLLWFLPFIKRDSKYYLYALNFFYFLGVFISLFFNFIDLIYFRFTLKRTTADVLTVIGNSNDFFSLLPSFILDFWYVVLLFVSMLILVIWFIKKGKTKTFPQFSFYTSFFVFFIVISLLLLAFRGGWQYKPIAIVNAANYASPQQVPIVLNTPFTFFKTLTESRLQPKLYMDENKVLEVFNADLLFKSEEDFSKKNVVLLILESFSKEYIGYYNSGNGYTPFLDSLLSNSTVYMNCFANGKQSIEAIPAITSALPTLMDDSYITSPYAGNKINSLASVLNEKGYSSHFYHGGNNGTMSFDAFAKAAGYNFYYGKSEYPFKGDDDGNWGIFDEPYLQYVASDLNKKKEPFHAAIFTLSSHHPFSVPQKYKGKFPKGEYEILESIGYADYALKQFFINAKQTNWYANTIFILTADHTSISSHPYYKNSVGNYAIPLAIFNPNKIENNKIYTISQQTDILPTALKELNFSGTITSFGNIADNNSKNNFCVNYSSGIYQFMNDSCLLQFNGEESIALYNYKNDSLLTKNVLTENQLQAKAMEIKLKAIIQSYQQRLLKNQLTPIVK
jgi:phosphoglycerol transferase MdoB-like AlkP superfamily enzyme